MRVKVNTAAMKNAADQDKKDNTWSRKKALHANTRRVVNIADLGNKSYLGLEFFAIPDIPGNENLKILD